MHTFKGHGHFEASHGLAVWGDVFLVSDWAQDCIHVHRLSDGGHVRSFGQAELDTPGAITVDNDDGLAYVSETPERGPHRVSVWKLSDGTLVRRWGSKGNGDGQFDEPSGIALSKGAAPLVYVADDHNGRIQVFTKSGSFVRSFGSKGSGTGQLHSPRGICLQDNLLYVADMNAHRVSVFNATSGTFVRTVVPTFKTLEKERPCWARYVVVVDGWMAVLDFGNHCVFVLNAEDGSLVNQWGSRGIGPYQFNYPCALCWNDNNDTLLVADTDNDRVVVYK